MPESPALPSFSEALLRFGGMYGSAWRDGLQLSEAIEVGAAAEVNRIEVPLVGTTKTGYKPGRESREGTIRVQKFDTKWEMEIWTFLSQSLADRRAARDEGQSSLRPFTLLLEYDDPDALGIEKWQLDGCLIWRLPLGFSIADDIVDREFPLTWEKESPIYAFSRGVGPNGQPVPDWYAGYGPPPS